MSVIDKLLDRREFLRSCARNITFTGLALFGGAMLLRKHDDKSRHVCINEFICSGCGAFSGCILPQAMSAKSKENNNKELSK